MGILNKLLGVPNKDKLKERLENGALLLDVRTKEEFKAGHVKGSINIPLTEIPHEYRKLNKDNPIIAICESGVRSAQVVRLLNSKGFQSYNGGSWKSFR